MFRRTALAAAALLALGLSAPPSDAAGKTAPLYFGNVAEGSTEGCTPEYELLTVQTDGGECSGTIVAAAGNGLVLDCLYTSQKGKTFKLDVSRNVTGTVYVHHIPVLTVVSASLPGYVEATITVAFDGKTVGTFDTKGAQVPPAGLVVPVDMKIPASFKNKVVKKITAFVEWKTATGLTAVSHSQPYASHIDIPVK